MFGVFSQPPRSTLSARRSLLSVVIVAAASIFPVLAQQQAAGTNKFQLDGQAFDVQGATLPGAQVTLRQNGGGSERAVTTDASGAFRFVGLARGQYRISATSVGFSDTVEDVTLTADKQDVRLILEPGTIAETVTVTATRAETLAADTPVPVSVVERRELERRNLNTIGDVFRDLPGVTIANEGPFQVRPRIRGLESNRVLVLVDGERLNNTRTSTSNSGIEVGLVEIDQIERVEVARGSGSVLYGTDALAGTINIITRDTPPRRDSGFRLGGGINGFFSSNETGRRGSAFLTGAGSRFAFRISQTLDRFSNYHSGAVPLASGGKDGSDQATEVLNSQYHGSNTQLVGRFFIDDSQTFRATYQRRRAANIGFPGLAGVFTAFFPFSNRDKFGVRYEGANLLSHLTSLSISGFYQKQDRNFSNTINVPAAPPFFPGTFQFSETITNTTTTGFDLQSNWTLGLHDVLTAGVSYTRDRNRDSRFIERLLPNFATNPPSLRRSTDNSNSVPNATFGDLAFFAQNQYEVNAKVRIIGGLRLDKFVSKSERTTDFNLPPFLTAAQIEDLQLTGLDVGLKVSDTALSGDVGVVYKPIDSLSLTARVGRSFREPNLFERFFTDFGSVEGFVVGNPNLKPESGVNVDTGVALRTARFKGSFTYFNNHYTNFLTSVLAIDRNGVPITVSQGPGRPPIDVYRTVNLGRTRIQGVEAEFAASFQVARSLVTPFGNVSYVRGNDLESDVPLNFITPLKTVVGFRWQDRRERCWAEWETRIVNRQDRLTSQFLATNGGAEPGYATHSLRAGYNFRRERYTLGLVVAVDNLLNRYYSEQFVFSPARGRTASAGINLRFF